MVQVGVHEAKTHLSRLLARVSAGEEVVITRSGVPVAKLVAVERSGKRRLGQDQGLFTIPPDFDDQLPDEILDLFEQ